MTNSIFLQAATLFTVLATLGCGASAPATDAGSPPTDAGPAAVTSKVAVAFDAMKAELPEGLALDGETAYVGLALTGQVLKVDLRTGARTPFGQVPMPPQVGMQPGGVVTGLAIDAAKNVYATLDVTSAPADGGAAITSGIYRLGPAGGLATAFASSPELVFPNGMQIVDTDLFVTDSMAGAVFKVALQTGAVTRWVQSSELAPLPGNCGPSNVRLGANGIVKVGDAFYVSNTDRAQIVKVPVVAGGAAGQPTVFFGPDCARLFGIDDVRALPNGDLVYAVNYANTVEAVTSGKVARTLFKGAPLDGAASLEVQSGPLRVQVTNSAFASFFSMKPSSPSLVTLTLE